MRKIAAGMHVDVVHKNQVKRSVYCLSYQQEASFFMDTYELEEADKQISDLRCSAVRKTYVYPHRNAAVRRYAIGIGYFCARASSCSSCRRRSHAVCERNQSV